MTESKTLEILKMAILMEHRGKAFYKKVAEQTDNEEVRNIFNLMADEEQTHIEFLSEQFAYYQKNQKINPDKLGLSQTDDSIAKTILSSDLKTKLSAVGYEAAAIAAAMDMEKKAIAVYSERAKSATDQSEKELYTWLANWENDHLNILAQLDKELMEKVWYDNSFWPF
ncbi:MAG: ferritin family protein [Bacteroidales bacterium]|jgi:rubrerythrin|nr:ferritin family protein [Bacteroidales bacterium]